MLIPEPATLEIDDVFGRMDSEHRNKLEIQRGSVMKR